MNVVLRAAIKDEKQLLLERNQAQQEMLEQDELAYKSIKLLAKNTRGPRVIMPLKPTPSTSGSSKTELKCPQKASHISQIYGMGRLPSP